MKQKHKPQTAAWQLTQPALRASATRWLLTTACWLAVPGMANAAALATVPVRSSKQGALAVFEGQVQALRQAQVAAQVAGTVTALHVKAGDHVRAGQELLRIDAQVAQQALLASQAQVSAARAQAAVAEQNIKRKQQLFEQHYVSQAALDQAQLAYQGARDQLAAFSAQSQASASQTGFYQVKAPFDGVVSQVTVERGDLATPGRPLLTVYEPQALRVSAAVPASALTADTSAVSVQVGSTTLKPTRVQVLPAVDPSSLTQEVRADLPAGTALLPGAFARLLWPGAAVGSGGVQHVFVPRSALVQRAEVSAVYVLDAQGAVQLRQVRLGQGDAQSVEVLSGLDAGEAVVQDAQAATRAAKQAK